MHKHCIDSSCPRYTMQCSSSRLPSSLNILLLMPLLKSWCCYSKIATQLITAMRHKFDAGCLWHAILLPHIDSSSQFDKNPAAQLHVDVMTTLISIQCQWLLLLSFLCCRQCLSMQHRVWWYAANAGCCYSLTHCSIMRPKKSRPAANAIRFAPLQVCLHCCMASCVCSRHSPP